MFRSIFFGLLGLVCIVLAVAFTRPDLLQMPRQAEAVSAPNYEAGDTWMMRYSNTALSSSTSGSRLEEKAGDPYSLYVRILDAEGNPDPKMPFLPSRPNSIAGVEFPLTIGNKMTTRHDDYTMTETCTVVGRGEISVAAGTFKAVNISCQYSYDDGNIATGEKWYAPSAKTVVFERRIGTKNTVTIELSNYNVH